MFELSLAIKYLIPKRARLSVALIGALSVAVVSLVVWLILVFLSVTEGIEKGWLQKLTTLHGEIRITPTQHYYNSYYYQIDSLSSSSGYSYKNLSQKAKTKALPYDPLSDGDLPFHFPKPDLNQDQSHKDPVQGLLSVLKNLQKNKKISSFQDFEISGALLRLQILNPVTGNVGYVTQASYLATAPNSNPLFSSLLLPSSAKELNHVLRIASHSTEFSRQDSPAIGLKTSTKQATCRIQEALKNTQSLQLATPNFWELPQSLLKKNTPFSCIVSYDRLGNGKIEIPANLIPSTPFSTVIKQEHGFTIDQKGKSPLVLPLHTPVFVQGPLQISGTLIPGSDPLQLYIRSSLQGHPIEGAIPWQDFSVDQVSFSKNGPSWLPISEEGRVELPISEEKEAGILLAKSFQSHGVQVGDRGYLSYSNAASGALQEQRLAVFVSGFYDPGVFSLGSKCILVPSLITETINASNTSFYLDNTQSNGFLLWLSSLNQTKQVSQEIQSQLTALGLGEYWKVTSFTDYDFAKELLEQFQSDKLLFMLIGALILIVGCCNIVSMGVLLVNDKKKEMGILQAMGATKGCVMRVFAYAGALIGIVSSLIGTTLALLTLSHIKTLVSLFGFLQGGNSPFNPSFFGETLPHTLSPHALLFILWITPLLALISGLIPAIQAARLQPSTLLKTE